MRRPRAPRARPRPPRGPPPHHRQRLEKRRGRRRRVLRPPAPGISGRSAHEPFIRRSFPVGLLVRRQGVLMTAAQTTGRRMLNKVPEVTVYFWVIKILCTTVGETFADYLNDTLGLRPDATRRTSWARCSWSRLIVQFRLRKYVPPVYWLAVVLISVVGTLITDNLVENSGISLPTSTRLRGRAAAVLRRLVRQRAHAVDPLDLHDPPRGVLLAHGALHLRARHRRRRPDRREAQRRLLEVGAALRRGDRARRSPPTACFKLERRPVASGSPTS